MNVTVNLTVAQSPLPVIVHVVQGNTEIPVDFHITDYTILAGSTARFYLKKKSGAEVYNNCTISGNVITLDPTAQTFAEAGCQAAQLQVEIGEDFLLSFPMTFDVAPNIIDDSAIESSSEYGALESLLQEAQTNIPAAGEAATAANQAAQAANNAAGTANNAANAANTAAAAANQAKQNADTATSAANNAANAANTAAGQANTARDAANNAANAANTAATAANRAKQNADTAADAANSAANAANTAAGQANTAKDAANSAASAATTAANQANSAKDAANSAASSATTAAGQANRAAGAANAAANAANSAAEKINVMDDYVVEQGKTGGWTYIKWNSGRSEAYRKTTSTNLGTTGQINGFYYRVYEIAIPAGLFTSIDDVHVSCDWGTGVSWGSVKEITTTSIEALYFSNQNGGPGTFFHSIKGRWK